MSLLRKFIPGNEINNVLYKAIYSNDVEKVNSVIDDVGISYCPLWAEGYDLILTALECKHLDIATLLVKKGCNIEGTQSGISGAPKSVIHLAARQGDVKLLSLLLDRDLDSLTKIEQGDSLLHVAISESRRDILEILLERGVDVEFRSGGGMTPLHLAALRGNLDILEQVLMAGACLESQDSNGKTSLFLAVSSGHRHVVRKLLELGANCNCKSKSGQTPLLDATNKGYIEIVKDLLDFDADMNGKNSFGQTSLHIACMQKNKILISILLNAGADVNAIDSHGMVPCDAIVKKVSPRSMYFENSSVSYLLGKHLTILKVGGVYLNKKNQMFYDLFYKMYCNEIVIGNSVLSAPSGVLHSTVKLCEDQINLMKITSDRGITVYNIFKKLNNPLNFVSKSELDFLASIKLKENFSLYEPLFRNLLKLSKLRNEVLGHAQERLSFIISLSRSELPALPEEMVLQILYHLTNDELKHLVKISKVVTANYKS